MRLFKAEGGLANRLRAVFSRFDPVAGLDVIWDRYWDAAYGHFLDVFEPIEGLSFVLNSGQTVERSCEAEDIGHTRWHEHYRLLRPLPEYQRRIDDVLGKLGVTFDAVHVRRTDHVSHVAQWNAFTPDAFFLEWVSARNGPLFLATDNAETRGLFASTFPNRIRWQGDMEPGPAIVHTGRRFNSLGDAVVDLFVATQARDFLGTPLSSFSDLIQTMRELRR